MTPLSLSFQLSLILIYSIFLLSALQYCLSASSSCSSKNNQSPKDVCLSSCDSTKHTKQQHSTWVHTLPHSLSRCLSFNIVTPAGSSQNTKVIHENFTRQELWCWSWVAKKASFPKKKKYWEEKLYVSLRQKKEMMSWLPLCIRIVWIHRGPHNGVEKMHKCGGPKAKCKIKVFWGKSWPKQTFCSLLRK